MVEAASALFAKCSPRGRVPFAPKSPCAVHSGGAAAGIGEISRVSRAFVKAGKKGTRFPRDDDDIEWAAITETPFQLCVVVSAARMGLKRVRAGLATRPPHHLHCRLEESKQHWAPQAKPTWRFSQLRQMSNRLHIKYFRRCSFHRKFCFLSSFSHGRGQRGGG